jgi:uncharacterized protein YndB with AHSA1/START domain
MKTFLKWAAIAMLALVLLCTLAYFLVGPVQYETRFEVDKPVAVTWSVLMDEERASEWLGGLQSIETIEGEPKTVGSRHRLTFVENETEFVMEETVTAIVPEKEFSFLMTHEVMEADMRILLEGLGERTVVVTENEVRGKGLLKLVMPLMKAGMVSRQEQGYAVLKALIEAEEG